MFKIKTKKMKSRYSVGLRSHQTNLVPPCESLLNVKDIGINHTVLFDTMGSTPKFQSEFLTYLSVWFSKLNPSPVQISKDKCEDLN